MVEKTNLCISCGKRAREGLMVLCAECKGVSIDLPQGRYLEALRRIRGLIAGGLRLSFVDSTAIGNKFTHCSWGLCSGDDKAWPDPEDHLFPYEFETQGRVAVRYRRGKQVCPLCRRREAQGCFYECRVFRPMATIPTREEVLQLYDAVLKGS